MNKEQIFQLSLKIKELIKGNRIDEASEKIRAEELSNEEMDFLFMCLQFGHYNPRTGQFLMLESDNAEFIKLVNMVRKKVEKK